MPAEVDWPNALIDIVVLSWQGVLKRQFTIRPRRRGHWRLLVWPSYHVTLAEPFQADLMFFAEDDLAKTVDWTPVAAYRDIRRWSWKLFRIEEDAPAALPPEPGVSDADLPLDAAAPLSDQLMRPSRLKGRFDLFELSARPHSLVVWSCNQPYEGNAGETPRVIEGTDRIWDWYADRIEALAPDIVYALGDTAYSDGCAATNFVDHYYGRQNGLDDPEERMALRREYQRMYRHHWSFDSLRYVQQSVPHICIWDDHELRDGSGSEAEDFQGANPVIREIATEVASAYILKQGPRVRPGVGNDAHKAYRYRNAAVFVFDGRSGREYLGSGGKVITDAQMVDFEAFCDRVASDSTIRFLLLGTAVPFINTKDFIEELGSKAPKLVTDAFAGIRDDVRDSWHSPGNRAQLDQLLGIVRRTLRRNDDCVMVNLSGDVHISNAFSFTPPGFTRACYQVTTSAITNRQHLPSALGSLFETGTWDFSSSLGIIHRIWSNVRHPNFLHMQLDDQLLELRLNVFDESGETAPGALDKIFTIGRERFGLRRALIA